MRGRSFGDAAAALATRVPRLHGTFRAAARWRAGRHHLAAVGVVIDGDRVLVAEHAFRGGAWALPGGWVNAREDPAAAVTRELLEEVALDVTVVDIVAWERQGLADRPLRYAAVTLAFLCRPGDGRTIGTTDLSPELRAVRWVRRDETAEILSAFEHHAVGAAFDRLSAG